jgi:hypothetical protein
MRKKEKKTWLLLTVVEVAIFHFGPMYVAFFLILGQRGPIAVGLGQVSLDIVSPDPLVGCTNQLGNHVLVIAKMKGESEKLNKRNEQGKKNKKNKKNKSKSKFSKGDP